MNQPKKNWTFTSSQPEDAQQFLWSQGSHKVAWSSPQYLEMFWSRIEWPSRADLSQWPNGQQNCLSAYPVLHRTELPNWKKMRQQTGKNDILWSYPATSLPICVTRKSVIKVNKKFTVSCVFIQLSLWKVDILQQACINDGVQVALHCTPQHCLTMSIEHVWIRSSANTNEHLRQEMKHRIPLEMVDSFQWNLQLLSNYFLLASLFALGSVATSVLLLVFASFTMFQYVSYTLRLNVKQNVQQSSEALTASIRKLLDRSLQTRFHWE